jgi:hypothetical protein
MAAETRTHTLFIALLKLPVGGGLNGITDGRLRGATVLESWFNEFCTNKTFTGKQNWDFQQASVLARRVQDAEWLTQLLGTSIASLVNLATEWHAGIIVPDNHHYHWNWCKRKEIRRFWSWKRLTILNLLHCNSIGKVKWGFYDCFMLLSQAQNIKQLITLRWPAFRKHSW